MNPAHAMDCIIDQLILACIFIDKEAAERLNFTPLWMMYGCGESVDLPRCSFWKLQRQALGQGLQAQNPALKQDLQHQDILSTPDELTH